MNYFGKFDATISDALGKHPGGHLFSETVHASHSPSDAIVVPDAQLLFGGEFKRAGVDLVLSGDGREYVLHDYFKGEKHAPLASPDGAHLTGDLVNALAGQVQIAQAGGNAAAGQVIGHVTKLTGTATAIRNGVSIILNNGDNVEKGDVVASGSDSTVGITFIDGTVFGLSSNARMVLNEMVYDPNGSNNSSLLSLVAGTITFVAGETAKHGDMKVDTPVATMGIRGTAVLVEIDFSVPGTTPDAKFQVLVEPDGTTGSYILFDKTTLTPLAVVDRAGMQINVSNGIMSQTLAPLSPEIQKLITDVFSLKFSDSTNTKAIEHFTDSIVPNAFGPVQFALANGNGVVTFSAPPPAASAAAAAAPAPGSGGHIGQAPQINSADPGKITELPHVTGNATVDKVTGQIQYYDVNATDHDTVSVKFSSFTYQDAKGHDVTGSLTSLQLADIAKVEAAVTVTDNTGPNVGGFGSANWNYSVADKAFDFLAAGETLTLTYTATVDNNYQPFDQTGSQTITITITGTNDVPVITSPQQNVSFAASGTDTKGGDLIPNTATHGTLVFTDPDLTDTHTVAVNMTSALLDGQPLSATAGQIVINELAAAVTASIAKGDDSTGSGTGTIDWTLANLQVYLADLVPSGESLVLTYAVTVTDSQGATSTQDIVVTIGGNNEAAVVWTNTTPIPLGGVAQWSDAANWEGDRAPSAQGTDDVFIGTDQLQPGTPVFPATVTDAEAAKSLTMDYFTDFGTSIPELDVLSTGNLTIVGALKMDTSTDDGAPLTAESIIKNFGTISVGGIAELLKHSVLDNYGTITLAKGGVFGDQSSITNSGTIEVVSGTLDVEVGIANFVTTTVDDSPVTTPGTIQVDGGATLKLSDGAVITKGEVTLGNLSLLDVEKGAASLPAGTPDATLDGVTVIGTSGPTGSTIEIGVLGAATLLLDDGTVIKNGDLTISAGSALDIATTGAALDGVNVTGTNGSSGGMGAMLGGLDAHAGVLVSASTIEVGTTTTTGTVLTLDDGTTITNGNLIIDGGNTLDIESNQGATLDGVNVMNSGTIQVDGEAGPAPTTVTLVLDGGTTITDGALLIHELGSPDEGIVEIGAGGATLDDVTVTNNNLLKVDSGATLTLEDGTTITGGTVTVEAGGSLDVDASGATLDDLTLSGSVTNSGTLTIKNTVTLNGATINGGTIEDTGTLTGYGAISSVIAGLGALTASGGTLTLTGDNLYTGTTTINGTLVLSGLGSIADSSDIIDNGTLDISGTTSGASIVTLSGDGTVDLGTQTLTLSDASTTFSGAIDGSGGLTLTTGTETLTGDNLYTGVTTINGGTLKLSGAGSIADSSNVIDNGTFDISGTTSGASIVTLSGTGTVDLGTQTLTLSDASTTFSGAIGVAGDTGGLTLTAGTETLTGDNLYTGATTINGGTLKLSGTGSIADSSDVIDDGTLDISATTSGASIVTLSGTGTVDLGTQTLTLTDASTTFSGAIDGSGGLTLTAGTETLTGDNLYTGVTTINGGTLALSGTGSIADSSDIIDDGTLDISGTTSGASIVTLSGTGTVDLGTQTLTLSDASTTFSGAIDGSGGLTLTAGTETLTGDNLYTGVTTINGGTLALSGTGSIADSSDVVDDGTLDISATTSGASIVTLSGDGTVDLGTQTLTLSDASTTFSGAIDGSGGLTLTAGTETLTGDNLYTGATTINGGTLKLSGTGSIADSSDVVDNGTFDISATTSGASIVTLSGDGAVTLGTQTLTLTDASTTFSGAIDGSGGLTLTTGTETLTGDNLYTGVTTINGGTLKLSGAGSIADSSNVIDNGTFDISGTTSGASIVTLSGTGTVDLGTQTLTLSDASTTFSGAIGVAGDTGGLTLTAGTETLTGDNLYTGATTINGGTLKLSGTGSIADSSDVVDDGTLDISATTSGASIVTLSGTGTVDLGTQTLTLSDASTTFSGAIDGSGGLTLTAGTETLTGDNLYTGATTINSGTLALSGTGSIADSSDIVDDGTLDISATTSGASIVTLSGNGAVTLGAETLTLSDASTTFSGAIDGSGGLTLTAGTETLTGDNLYTGATTINGGTLALSGTGSIADSSNVIDNGTFDISGTTAGASIVTLSGDGTVDLGTQTLTLSDASTTFSGAIGVAGDTGGLTLTAGTETLTGDNLYTGVTTINGGTLALSGTGSIADSSDVVDDGTLDISATTSGASIVTLSGDGAVTLGAETLTLTDASTTFSGAIDGSGGLTLTTGTETLTGDNLYTGATTIMAAR